MRRPGSVWKSWLSTSNLSATPEVLRIYRKSVTVCLRNKTFHSAIVFNLLSVSDISPGVGLSSTAQSILSRPMQRKLVTLVHCQLVEEEGRVRAMRAARSLGERTVTELILQHQNQQQLSSNLWAAVRARGCQFLGPGW